MVPCANRGGSRQSYSHVLNILCRGPTRTSRASDTSAEDVIMIDVDDSGSDTSRETTPMPSNPNNQQQHNGAAAAAGQQRALARQPNPQQPKAIVTAKVKKWETPVLRGGLVLHLHPCCPAHPQNERQSPCCTVLTLLRSAKGGWWLTPSGNVVTTTRECSTLARLQQLPLLQQLLQPDKYLAFKPEAAAAGGGTSNQPPPFPEEVARNAYYEYLRKSFDGPQIDAIARAASYLARGGGRGSKGGGGSNASGGAPGPFTLIQGPPGTGKTHTVLGVLNTWHLTQFQRFYGSLDAALRREAHSGMS